MSDDGRLERIKQRVEAPIYEDIPWLLDLVAALTAENAAAQTLIAKLAAVVEVDQKGDQHVALVNGWAVDITAEEFAALAAVGLSIKETPQ